MICIQEIVQGLLGAKGGRGVSVHNALPLLNFSDNYTISGLSQLATHSTKPEGDYQTHIKHI